MLVEEIMNKGRSGQKLDKHEVEVLMLHAIDLLDYIKQETLSSIARAQ